MAFAKPCFFDKIIDLADSADLATRVWYMMMPSKTIVEDVQHTFFEHNSRTSKLQHLKRHLCAVDLEESKVPLHDVEVGTKGLEDNENDELEINLEMQ